MNRSEMINKIKSGSSKYDFIIIGGGATGIGILLEAVSRGYSAILFEASDFSKSTSSKSTKLVHGGVRYLAQGNVKLVREASIERGRLLKNAPHLTQNMRFIIPGFNWFEELKYTIGLKLYDLLAGKFSLGKSRRISKKQVFKDLPNLKKKGITAGIEYHDGQFDDSRLAISLLRTAADMGALALNYMPVRKFNKNSDEKIQSVGVIDLETGIHYEVGGKIIVNATGVFADSIMELDHENHQKSIKPSQGVHLVVDRKFLPGDTALMIPKTDDGRVLFAVPWHNRIVLGTTDTPVDEINDEPVALESEIIFILNTAGKYLEKVPQRKDVLSVFAGLRPLAAPKEGEEKTREISRSHKIVISESGLLTIIGGKWTTYRKMADDMINRGEKVFGLAKTVSQTENLHIHGYDKNPDYSDPFYFYGTSIAEVENGKKDKIISNSLGITKNMVVHAVNFEMARTLEDFLARRSRALLLDAKETIAVADEVAEIMARELGEGTAWIEAQTAAFKSLANNYYLD